MRCWEEEQQDDGSLNYVRQQAHALTRLISFIDGPLLKMNLIACSPKSSVSYPAVTQ